MKRENANGRLSTALQQGMAERSCQLEQCTKQLEETSKLQDDLVRTMSLEVRPSLQSLMAYATVIPLKFGDNIPPELLAYVERVEESTAHILGLVTNLLDRAGCL